MIFKLIPNCCRIRNGNTKTIIACESKRLSEESYKYLILDIGLAPTLKWIHNSKKVVEPTKICLQIGKTTFTHGNGNNFFIVYEIHTLSKDLYASFTLADCLLGATKLINNADPNKYGYSGYYIGFDAHSQFFYQLESRVKMLLSLV